MEGAGDGAWKRINNILKKRSYRMDAAYSVKMPTNYMLLGDVLPKDQEIDDITSARSDLERIVGKISRGEKGFEKGPFVVNAFNNTLYPLLKGHLRAQGLQFQADDTCNECGTCELICPTYNITFNGMNPPGWGNT